MGRRKKTEGDNKDQSARFIETAERIKDEDDKEKFERACKTIIKGTQTSK
jgi:hypothetical protein